MLFAIIQATVIASFIVWLWQINRYVTQRQAISYRVSVRCRDETGSEEITRQLAKEFQRQGYRVLAMTRITSDGWQIHSEGEDHFVRRDFFDLWLPDSHVLVGLAAALAVDVLIYPHEFDWATLRPNLVIV